MSGDPIPVTNKGLTSREEIFCRAFVMDRCAADAFRKAYDTAGWTPRKVGEEAGRLVRKPKIQLRIRELQDELVAEMGFAPQKALSYFLQIAMADPNEIVSWRVGCCRHCHGEGHGYQWREGEFLEAVAAVEKHNAEPGRRGPEKALPDIAGGFGYDSTRDPHPECPRCDGEGQGRTVIADTTKLSPAASLLYGGVKQTAQGLQVILADRMKAMELAARLVGAFQDNVSIRAELKAASAVFMTDDPAQAAKAYFDMVAATQTG